MSPHLPTSPDMSAHVANLFSRERQEDMCDKNTILVFQVCAEKSPPKHIAKCKRGRMMVSVRVRVAAGGGHIVVRGAAGGGHIVVHSRAHIVVRARITHTPS